MKYPLDVFPSVKQWTPQDKGCPKKNLKRLFISSPLYHKAAIWLKGLSDAYGPWPLELLPLRNTENYQAVFSPCGRPPAGSRSQAPLPSEGYRLESRASGMTVQATDDRGLFYGLVTAFQMLAAEEPMLPGGMIADEPLFGFRSFQIDLARQPETLSTLKKWVIRSALFKLNRLGLYLEDAYDYRCCPGIAPAGALDASTFRELAAFGRTWGVEVFPMMNCYGHMENFLRHKQYAHLSEGREGSARAPWLNDAQNIICANLPEARDLLRRQIEEWGSVYDGELLHVGMDECWNFASCSLCRAKAAKQGVGRVFLSHLLFLHEVARSIGKTIGIWGDVAYWFPEIVPHIPKDVVIFDWEYSHVPARRRYCELNHLATDPARWLVHEHGFQMVACPATDVENIRSFRHYCDPHRIRGFHITTWEMNHKFLDECFTGLAYGAEVNWAQSPIALDRFPEVLGRVWFGSNREEVRLTLAEAPSGYAERGSEWIPPIQRIRHEVSAETLNADRRLRRVLAGAETAPGLVQRHGEMLAAIRLILRRTGCSAALDRLVNESVLAMRELLIHPEARHLLHALRNLLAELKIQQACLKSNTVEFEKAWRRERGRIPMRHHAGVLQKAEPVLRNFIHAVERFLRNPRRPPVELGRYWVVVDLAEVDPNYRLVRVEGSATGKRWKPLATIADAGFTMCRQAAALLVTKPPAYLRLTVSRIGASAIQNVRVLGWREEYFPSRIIATRGKVQWPEHLLRDDYRAALVGEPDVWKLYHHPERTVTSSSITMQLKPYVPYPAFRKGS